ncbi:MAG: helix-turn-helix domain-containing protein [Treponema sp.]|jgi:cytoskeletal protein RodZ|nr:helix-turn-helix domain-containing protein [Treponema sp.]
MESLGSKLKSTRESKGYSIEQVSRDTNIAGRYLEALEKENFAIFPGDAYLLGFLKNYGEFLGLNGKELLDIYRAMKIQEQPVPVEQLLTPHAPIPVKLLLSVLIGLLILAAVGGGVYFFLQLPRREPPPVSEVRGPEEYIMDTTSLERRFYQGDSLIIPYGTDQYGLELTNLGEALRITTPDGEVMLDLGKDVTVDLNSDGIGELRISAVDFVKNTPAAGALLRFELDNTLPLFNGEPGGVSPPEISASGTLPPERIIASNTGLANATVIFSSPSAYPFTTQAMFQGYCMFRWEILSEQDRRNRNEQYFQRGEELNIQAQNGIRVWVSNAAMVKLQVIGGGRTVPLELGVAGEVVVADIRWVWDDDNRYRLVLVRLE